MKAPSRGGTFVDPRTGARQPLAAFVDAFARLWADPAAAGYRFLDLLAEDVVLEAPLVGESRGRAAGYAGLRRSFALLPDLRATTDGWAEVDGALWIAMRFCAEVGGRVIRWPNVDVFTFADGLAVRRVAHFDPLPLAWAVTRSPGHWRRFLRFRFGAAPKTWPGGARDP